MIDGARRPSRMRRRAAAYLSILSDVLAGNPNVILTTQVANGSWSTYANFYRSLRVDGPGPVSFKKHVNTNARTTPKRSGTNPAW